jgi:hypothetical protein
MAVLEFVLRLDVYIDVILELDISTSDFWIFDTGIMINLDW